MTGIPSVFLMTDSFQTGGSERQFAMLAGSIDPSKFNLSLGCIQKRGSFLEGFDNVQEYPLGGSLYGWRSMQARVRLARYLVRSRTQIAHAFDFYTNLVLIPAARMAGVPVVIGSQRQLGDLLGPAKARAQRMALRWSDTVVCNSRAAAELLVAEGLSRDKISIIGNGLPPAAFTQISPAIPRVPGKLRVGIIARMNTPAKNHAMFLRVASLLASRFKEIEFLLIGDGPLRPELEKQALDLGLQDKAHFLGDRRDIPALLASMDVSVLPSKSESLSNAILESMAAGVPVVANRVGGNPELISSDRGILVPPNEELAMAHAVEKLLRDSEMRGQLALKAKEFAEANFSVAATVQQHEELYGKLLDRHANKIPCLPLKEDGRRLRVAIVAASMRYVGGQSVQADLLLDKWRGDREVEAFLVPIDPPFPHPLRWAERVPFLRTMIRQPIYLRSLWRNLKNADIAHIFSASYSSFLIAPLPALWVALLRRKKTVLHYHSGEARDHLRRSPVARSFLAKADRLIVPSGYLVDVFQQFALEAQAVPNVVDLQAFAFRRRGALRPHLLCTRGFHPYYCVDVVVRAFSKVQRVFPEARLNLVGQGPDEPEIRQLVRDLALRNVTFSGVATREKIPRFYDLADIFINASSVDNMPVSLMEAFASGCPVVTTAPECMPYLIEHERTGMLSKPGDPHALAQNVIRLLNEPELGPWIAANAHAASMRFGWAEVKKQWLAVYGSLLGESARIEPELTNVA